jgi:Secretion system C-terminal sorting domain
MKKFLQIYIASLIFIIVNTKAQTGNYVFTGAEAVNFSTIDLTTPGTQTWVTDRSIAPGYFSATMGAAYSSPSDAANINGYVKKYGNEVFTFPVGSGIDLRTVTISAPALTTDAYSTAWILGDPSGNMDPTSPNAGSHSAALVSSPIISVSTVGQWDWQVGANLGATGTGAGLTITVSIPDMTAFAIASNLRLVGWNGISWVDLSGAATASGNTENSTLSGTMVAGITAIAIGSTSSILPIQLQSFTGTSSNCNAIINWKTLQEINTDKFIVQKSADGVNFVAANTVKAADNISGNAYQVTLTQETDAAYYRLQSVDYDGTYSYSKIVLVKTQCNKENIAIYPNPVNGVSNIQVNVNTLYKSSAEIIVTNINGQKVINIPVLLHAGINNLPVPISKMASGTYFLTVITKQGLQVGAIQKFIK